MLRLPAKQILTLLVIGIAGNSCSSVRRSGSGEADAKSSRTVGKDNDFYYDIGGFHRAVTTKSSEAPRWFDRGLAMRYAFNYEEAVRCFEYALEEDPSMPMTLWGMAYAWGPNINNLEIPAHQIAQAALALRLAEFQSKRTTKLERDLIEALGNRYSVPAPDDRKPLNKAYSDAMRTVHKENGDAPLIAFLFTESLMILRPWNHWSKDGKPAIETPEIMEVLERALEKNPEYPALCHLYIHTMEASPTPGKALPAANRLRNAMPGAGHLVHMPSHIDVLIGDYKTAVTANQKAIMADAEFIRHEGVNKFFGVIGWLKYPLHVVCVHGAVSAHSVGV